MNSDRKAISGANIVVPKLPIPPEKDGTTAIFTRLRQLKRDCGAADRHAIALTLIEACIKEGINTRYRIRGALKHLGLNPDHAVIMLNGATGSNPSQHRWQRNAEGLYSLLEPTISGDGENDPA